VLQRLIHTSTFTSRQVKVINAEVIVGIKFQLVNFGCVEALLLGFTRLAKTVGDALSKIACNVNTGVIRPIVDGVGIVSGGQNKLPHNHLGVSS